jgi:hypothetical protein
MNEPALARSETRRVTVAGGTLFRVALIELGDATQWDRIAAANGLTDPWLAGVVTLIVPARDATAGNGGILAPV